MNKIAVLRAQGPNEVETIAMVFASLADGEKFMDDVFAPYADTVVEKAIRRITAGVTTYEDAPAVRKVVSEDGLKIDYNVRHEVLDLQAEDDDENEEDGAYVIHDKIFTSYYDGCGGVDHYSIELVDAGTKLIGWSLD